MVNFRKWMGKNDESEETLLELTLSTMKVGYLVDYDLNTWQVIGINDFDYDGYPAREWELRYGDEVRFLERGEDDGRVEWTLTRRVDLSDVDEDMAGIILDDGEPPEVVSYEDRRYLAVESSSGVQRRVESAGGVDEDPDDEGHEFVSWSYGGKDGRVLFLVQRGERDFAAYEGAEVQEYQFTDILPAPATSL